MREEAKVINSEERRDSFEAREREKRIKKHAKDNGCDLDSDSDETESVDVGSSAGDEFTAPTTTSKRRNSVTESMDTYDGMDLVQVQDNRQVESKNKLSQIVEEEDYMKNSFLRARSDS